MSTAPQLAPAQKLILVVDDTPLNIGVISGALKDSYKTEVAYQRRKSPRPRFRRRQARFDSPRYPQRPAWMAMKFAPASKPILLLVRSPLSFSHRPDQRRRRNAWLQSRRRRLRSQTLLARRGKGSRTKPHPSSRSPAPSLLLNSSPSTTNAYRPPDSTRIPSTPSFPELSGFYIVANYLPMTSVAGDFYDFIQIDDQHIGILIADASGHGLPSALIASMLQVALTGQAAHAAPSGQRLGAGL